MGEGFVGRADELAAIAELLAACRREKRVGALLLVGEPGIGKSRLLDEAERADGGRTIVRLAGYEPEAGVPLAAALQLSIRGCGNETIRRAFQAGEESLLDGQSMTQTLKKHKVLPSLFVELLVIGEETNSLRQSLEDAASAYQKQLERRLDALLAFLEPASTVIVGGIIGFIAFSMFVPIYKGLQAI